MLQHFIVSAKNELNLIPIKSSGCLTFFIFVNFEILQNFHNLMQVEKYNIEI